jgi:hypothetical protein
MSRGSVAGRPHVVIVGAGFGGPKDTADWFYLADRIRWFRASTGLGLFMSLGMMAAAVA